MSEKTKTTRKTNGFFRRYFSKWKPLSLPGTDEGTLDKLINIATTKMLNSSRVNGNSGREIKYDYLGAMKQALVSTGSNNEQEKIESLKKIGEKDKGVCWDYTKARKFIIEKTCGTVCWIAGYPCSAVIAPHTFLICQGAVCLDGEKWSVMPLYAHKRREWLDDAITKNKTIYKTLVVDDPFYFGKPFLPDDELLKAKRGAHALEPWYIMDNSMENLPNVPKKPKCCLWTEFAIPSSPFPRLYPLYQVTPGYKNKFKERNWVFYG